MVLLQRKLYFSKDPEGSTIFQVCGRGSNFFQEGVQMLISIEAYITYDFPGGGGGVRISCPPSGSAHGS